jgi:preprotein translocase subunit SecF
MGSDPVRQATVETKAHCRAGFLVVTRIQFDLVTVAAILTIVGCSTNDKVAAYDRVRENLRKYKAMPLRDLMAI